MKEYEIVHQVYNPCSGDQNADVDIREAAIEDLDSYMKQELGDLKDSMEKELLADGSKVFHVDAAGQLQKFTFTEI